MEFTAPLGKVSWTCDILFPIAAGMSDAGEAATMTIRVNPAVAGLSAYIPGEQPKEPGFTKLNTNENPYPPAPSVISAVGAAASDGALQKYPDPTSSTLRQEIAAELGLSPDEILVGNGSDEVLRLLCHAFLDPSAGDRIGVLNPSYVLYETLAAMFGAGTHSYNLDPPDYQIPSEAVQADVKLLFLPNPNPPIGTFYEGAVLSSLASSDSERLVVIDEAYVDFAPGNALPIYRQFENIVITRTFSKSYSLAGLRVGYVVARPELIREMDKIRDSYNVNRISQAAALAAWRDRDYHRACCQKVWQDREFLARELRTRGFTVPPSHGNFVFAQRAGARELYEQLKQRRVLVRYFSSPELSDGVRITVGTHDELVTLLSAIDALDGL